MRRFFNRGMLENACKCILEKSILNNLKNLEVESWGLHANAF